MKNAQRDHTPLEQEDFLGLYSRGLTDTVPDRFFSDCLNNKFSQGEVSSRDGSVLNLTKANIRRFFVYKRLGETPRFLVLDSSGNLFDSLTPGTPIFTDASFVDFSMVNYNNRAYITPHNRTRGIAGKSLLVYEGSGSARLAAGVKPTGFTLVAANSASSGSVETGIHLFAVVNVSSSGFLSAPGPDVFAQLNCPGSRKVNLSGVAVGGGSTIARILVATKSVPVSLFNGNQFAYELFFIPNGTINNNTATTITVDFFDADLQSSADYLIDNLATIPAGLGLVIYNNRLGIWTANGEEFTLRLSSYGQPECFNSITGFITIDPSDAGSGVKNAFEFRKNLIIGTSNKAYTTNDNGSDPSTWEVNGIDKSGGMECFSVATILDARGTNSDRAWIADRSGLIAFEGYYRRPELSFNIEDVWGRINKAIFNLVQVVDDPVNHRLFVSIPLDGAVAISHLLMGDYSQAFTVYGTIDERAIKWSIWSFPSTPVSIMGDSDSVTVDPVFHVALSAGNIYTVKKGLHDDFGNAIDSWFITSLKTARTSWINHFNFLKGRVIGSGILSISAQGIDASNVTSVGSWTLTATPGAEFELPVNYTNERAAFKFRVNTFGSWYTYAKLIVWAKEIWLRRAQ